MSSYRNSRELLRVAETGLLIALLIVVQIITYFVKPAPLVGQFITGSLVNLVLIVGAGEVGLAGATAAAVLSPVLAFLFQQMQIAPMIPVVAIGNFIIVIITWAFFRSAERHSRKMISGLSAAGIVIGAVVKMLFLWVAAVYIVVPVFHISAKIAKMIGLMFSWPQLVTGIIGGVLALLVLPAVHKASRSFQ